MLAPLKVAIISDRLPGARHRTSETPRARPDHRAAKGWVAAFAGAVVLWGAPAARANGAFPSSDAVLVPLSRPAEITLATNFGLVLSSDGGQTWSWRCESGTGKNATFYQMGAPPLLRVFALASFESRLGLTHSDDAGCSWRATGGAILGASVVDYFPDPTNAGRVLAIAVAAADGGVRSELWESSDGGATFEARRYTAAPGEHLLGVETAASSPGTIYLSVLGASGASALERSADGGGTWERHELTAALGPDATNVRLIAVDPDDAGRVFLRISVSGGDQIALTADGGRTIAARFTAPGGVFDGFARLAGGSLIVVAHGGATGIEPLAFRSTDGGMTFAPLPAPPPLRGLAARGGVLYGAVDIGTDYGRDALATSEDEGMTWRPLLRLDRIDAVAACVKASCREDCLARAGIGQWDPAFCRGPEPPAEPSGACRCDVAPGGALGLCACGLILGIWLGRARPARPARRRSSPGTGTGRSE